MTASHSPDLSEDLKQQLQILVPAAFKDGQLDTETLQRLLGIAAPPRDERYGLNWAGKADSYKALQHPTSATLRPRVDQSVDFEHAQHVFIEGENLEVLKVLQRAYFGKVKMIYIDPPYNTGSDSFIYPDRFQESREDYLKRIESLDIDGNITKEGLFRKNSKDNGHYHSNWLSMMLPRLYLARNLLRDDGVVFISIDDNEQAQLKVLCDEIFGEENFIGIFVVNASPSGIDYGHIAKTHDYAIFYAKNIEETTTNQLTEESKVFKYTDNIGPFNLYPLYNGNVAFNPQTRRNLFYPFYLNPNKKIDDSFYEIALEPHQGWIKVEPVVSRKDGIQRVWRWGKLKASQDLNKEIIGYKTEDGDYRIVQKTRHTGKVIRSLLVDNEVSSRRGTGDFEAIFNAKIFSFPKPIELIKRFIKVGTDRDSIIIDFFSGSGTTAQAVLELNQSDGGNRQFICVQMPEPTDEDSEAYKADYQTIADISRERIRRVISRIRQNADLASPVKENDPNLGFRAFELSPSNFKQWRGNWAETPEELDTQLELMLPAEKRGATPLDMAFELLLKNGRPLISHVELKTISATPVYIVWSQDAEDAESKAELMFVLESMRLDALPALLAIKAKHMIFLDSVFAGNDAAKVNISLQCESAGVKFSSI